MKVVFLGTPDFAIPSLQKLINASDLELIALITQPDKAVGRKQIITKPATKIFAEENKIKIYQPEKINNDKELIETIKAAKPDFLVTVAYGQILKKEILEIAPIINLHASLLPYYRGPAPINWMIVHGEKTVGVSTMLTNEGVDTGDILLQASTGLDQNENAEELSSRLAEIGANLLLKTLVSYGDIEAIKQEDVEEREKQFAPFMDKNLGKLDFFVEEIVLKSANPKQVDFVVRKENSALNIHNLIRALQPWPGAHFIYNDQKISILKTKVTDQKIQEDSGKILKINKDLNSFELATQRGVLEIISLKPEGRNICSGADWLNGQRLKIGDWLKA